MILVRADAEHVYLRILPERFFSGFYRMPPKSVRHNYGYKTERCAGFKDGSEQDGRAKRLPARYYDGFNFSRLVLGALPDPLHRFFHPHFFFSMRTGVNDAMRALNGASRSY